MKARLKKLVKGAMPILALALVGGLGLSLLTGDGCGPVERGFRAAIGAWDMWQTALVAPYEEPLKAPPTGTVPLGQESRPFDRAKQELANMSKAEQSKMAAHTFRRFCHHCHGPNGDGRIIVGESFGFKLPDLRSEHIQTMSDERIFNSLTQGTEKMIPLAATLSPLQRMLAIVHLRTLKGKKSTPFYKPRWVEPAEQPGGPAGE